jgi:hypothetical protein
MSIEYVWLNGIKYMKETFDTGSSSLTLVHDFPKTLVDVKNEKYMELEQAYSNSFTVFQSNATGTMKTYPINAEAKDNLERLQRRLIADPAKDSFSFYTLEDANLINHTRTQFLKLLDDAEAFEIAQHIRLNDRKKDVEIAYQAQDENAILAVVW